MSSDPKRAPTGNEIAQSSEQNQENWKAVEEREIAPESIPENGDFRYDDEPDGELPEEDNDNPYQESDEALPEDREERAISRDPSKGRRFDEV